jgi:hypothetical protein
MALNNKMCTLYTIFFALTMNTDQGSNGSGNGINLVELAERLGQYFIENLAAISIVVVVIIGALVYQQIMHVQLGTDITENSAIGSSGPNTKTVVVETFDQPDSLDAKMRAGFCKSHLGKPAELETECGRMSKHSCTATSCCVWAKMDSTESCVSGNQHGPIFKHGANGAPKPLDYYYFENKCKGNCPNK